MIFLKLNPWKLFVISVWLISSIVGAMSIALIRLVESFPEYLTLLAILQRHQLGEDEQALCDFCKLFGWVLQILVRIPLSPWQKYIHHFG